MKQDAKKGIFETIIDDALGEDAQDIKREFRAAADELKDGTARVFVGIEEFYEEHDVKKRLAGVGAGLKAGAVLGIIGGKAGIIVGATIGAGIGAWKGPEGVDALEKRYQDFTASVRWGRGKNTPDQGPKAKP